MATYRTPRQTPDVSDRQVAARMMSAHAEALSTVARGGRPARNILDTVVKWGLVAPRRDRGGFVVTDRGVRLARWFRLSRTNRNLRVEDAGPNANDLARAFSRTLREWLLPHEMDEVNARNAARPAIDTCCSSHDFCDANMAMDVAFTETFGLSISSLAPDGSDDSEKWMGIWNDAWKTAKAADFDADAIARAEVSR